MQNMTLTVFPKDDFLGQLTMIKELAKSKFSVYQVGSQDGSTYALKVFPKTEKGTIQYEKERSMIKLSHRNIIRYIPIKLPENAECNAVLSEFAQYGNFFQLRINNVIDSELVVRTYFHQLIEGLEHLHSQGAAHLDLKLENLMMGDNFTLKIIDFDQAQNIEDKKITSGGTKGYRAPEVITGKCTNFAAADVYSAGVILFALFAKEFPFVEKIYEINGKKTIGLENYMPFVKMNSKYWEMKAQVKKDSSFYSEDFQKLINGMLNCTANTRFTLEDIKKSRWYNGPILSPLELKGEMESRWSDFINKK